MATLSDGNSRTTCDQVVVLLDDAERALMSLPLKLRRWLQYDASVNWDPVWAFNQYQNIYQEGYPSDACCQLIIDFLRDEERRDLHRLLKH